jgi:hypothetical protein
MSKQDLRIRDKTVPPGFRGHTGLSEICWDSEDVKEDLLTTRPPLNYIRRKKKKVCMPASEAA